MKLGRNDACWCGSGKKYKMCHCAFDEKLEKLRTEGNIVPTQDMIKTPYQIEMIKKSAVVNKAVLDYITPFMKPGISTQKIDDLVAEKTAEMGAICAPLNYEGFPKSVCTSINSQVCHGIPSENVILKEGDIINVDCSTILDGFYSDSSRMYCIGEVSEERKKLVRVTKECCDLGLEAVKPWGHLGDVGAAICEHAHANGYTVVREIGGHGVGVEFHEDPWVGYNTKPGTEMILAPGLMFTIEPMVNAGVQGIYIDKDNGWEAYTADGADSAQWEYQVLVTETGVEVISD